MNNPEALGTDVANGSGNASLTFLVPADAAGKTAAFQAVELDNCRVSNQVVHPFE